MLDGAPSVQAQTGYIARRRCDSQTRHTVSIGNILHDREIQLLLGNILVRIQDFLTLLLRSDCCHDRMTTREESVEDMGGDETASTCMG